MNDLLIIIMGMMIIIFNKIITRDVMHKAIGWRSQKWSERKFKHMRIFTSLIGVTMVLFATLSYYSVDSKIITIILLAIIIPGSIIPYISK